MVRFLLHRPIAVIMAYLAIIILGCVTFVTLPVSLLPDVDIPHITVKVDGGNMSAREMENVMVAPLRRQLMQVSRLNEIKSETVDGSAIISLTMDYGVNTELSYIEVNEKIDAAMASLPKDAVRPNAVKASATDIPVVYLQLTVSDDSDNGFVQMADIVTNVVRCRLEQLPEIAMVDITGLPCKELLVTPDSRLLQIAGISIADIEQALSSSNAELGWMTVRDGQYEYNVHVSDRLRTPEDVRSVRLMKNGRIHTLGDLCKIEIAGSTTSGLSMHRGQRAITLALIKQSSASMAALDQAVDSTVKYLAGQYPNITFEKSRSQTQLLDFTISNLEQNLILGLILIFVVCVLFMRSFRLPFVIGITILVAVVIAFLMFFLFGVSINIISLAGLILAIGMMIDNSVIVAENITQYRQRGLGLAYSCVVGTNEMVTPMLSSSLTSVAVFVPLVFMSGIAGAIFTDQAFAITVGLASSYIVGITLMPVLYYLFFKKQPANVNRELPLLKHWYDKGMSIVFTHTQLSILFVAIVVVSVWPMSRLLDTEKIPYIDSSETVAVIDWNENITIDENLRRTKLIMADLDSLLEEQSAYISRQEYMMDNITALTSTMCEIYLRTSTSEDIEHIKRQIEQLLVGRYPASSCEFAAPSNMFEEVFSSGNPPLEARLSSKSGSNVDEISRFIGLQKRLEGIAGCELNPPAMREQINIAVNHDLLALYNVEADEVRRVLESAFQGIHATTLRSFGDYLPIRIADSDASVEKILSETFVKSRPGTDGKVAVLPLGSLVHTFRTQDFKTINADRNAEYIPVAFTISSNQWQKTVDAIASEVSAEGGFDVSFTGTVFTNAAMMRELAVVLIVSLLMMYFILCAQFESFIQPLIVLVEIPVDIFFALLCLWLFGQTINIMSAIGIIVTCGIVVNDSILKIDSINRLRKTGVSLYDAIHIAGHRRLKPIIMTSITTILAMVPVLFTTDMGSELQRPLAIAMIGSMMVGTFVSIFVIPLIYYLVYRKQKNDTKTA